MHLDAQRLQQKKFNVTWKRCHKIEQSLQPSREFFISQHSIVEELQVVEAQFNVRRLEMKIEVSAMKSRFSWLINLFRKSFWFDKTWS